MHEIEFIAIAYFGCYAPGEVVGFAPDPSFVVARIKRGPLGPEDPSDPAEPDDER